MVSSGLRLQRRLPYVVVLSTLLFLALQVSPSPSPVEMTLLDVDEDAVLAMARVVDNAQPGGIISININSLGGHTYEVLRLLAVSEMAHDKGVTVICTVQGLAASAAAMFFIAGCDRRLIKDHAYLMLHESSISKPLILGPVTPEEIQSNANLNEAISTVVARACKMPVEEYRKKVKAGSWMITAQEAVANGMADVVLPGRGSVP